MDEMTNLTNCIKNYIDIYDKPLIFIRGDSNANKKNVMHFKMFTEMLNEFSLSRVMTLHPTYHHFIGNGAYDSCIDVLAYPDENYVKETIDKIICKLDTPMISSHHDIILSSFCLPLSRPFVNSSKLKTAPRFDCQRTKIFWSMEGAENFKKLVSPQLLKLRQSWTGSDSAELASLHVQYTNDILIRAAKATNPWKIVASDQP